MNPALLAAASDIRRRHDGSGFTPTKEGMSRRQQQQHHPGIPSSPPRLETSNSIQRASSFRKRWIPPNVKIARLTDQTKALTKACEKGDLDLAFTILDQMEQDHLYPRLNLLMMLMKECTRGGHHDKAMSLLSRPGFPVSPKLFTLAITCSGRAGRWKDALWMLGRMEACGLPPDGLAYAAAMSACSQAGQWERALALLEDVRGGVEGEGRVGRPDTAMYNAALGACTRAARSREAEGLWQQMKEDGVRRDVVTFNTMMDLCSRVGKTDLVFELWTEMEGDGGEGSIIEKDIITYNTAMIACVKKGWGQEALRLFRELQEGEAGRLLPDRYTYAAALSACAKEKDWAFACKLLEEMERKGIKRDTILYNSALDACAKAGQYEAALGILESMQQQGRGRGCMIRPDSISYGAVMEASLNGGLAEKTVDLLRGMEGQGVRPDNINFGTALTALSRSRGSQQQERDLTLDLFEDMLEKGISPDQFNLRLTLDYVRQQEGEEQWERLVEMVKGRVDADGEYVAHALILSAIKEKWSEGALRLYLDAIASPTSRRRSSSSMAEREEGADFKACGATTAIDDEENRVINALVRSFSSRQGDWLSVLQQIESRGPLEVGLKGYMLGVRLCCRLQRFEEGEELIKGWMAKGGDQDGAEQLMRMLQKAMGKVASSSTSPTSIKQSGYVSSSSSSSVRSTSMVRRSAVQSQREKQPAAAKTQHVQQKPAAAAAAVGVVDDHLHHDEETAALVTSA